MAFLFRKKRLASIQIIIGRTMREGIVFIKNVRQREEFPRTQDQGFSDAISLAYCRSADSLRLNCLSLSLFHCLTCTFYPLESRAIPSFNPLLLASYTGPPSRGNLLSILLRSPQVPDTFLLPPLHADVCLLLLLSFGCARPILETR